MIRQIRANSDITNYLLLLVVGAAIIWIVREITNPLLAESRSVHNGTVATTSRGWIDTFIANMPIIWLFLGVFGMLVLAVARREVAGR